ncbi:stage V sporulation protein AA [Pseudogracilibacillus sp. SE30717A]|uniref:stage V sporulation protein AA n=1 Tax=Pseudogracilibacillus sp. SE30717A TaxID=3098293 RepID=UPI00300DCEBD
MNNIVYLRMKKKTTVLPGSTLKLKDIAFISTTGPEKEKIENTHIYRIKEEDNDYVLIDCFLIISHFNKVYPNLEFELVGYNETIVHVKEKAMNPPIILISFVWLILFIGSAMTIINFHYDVSMQEVQQRIHYIFTGKKEEFPLWIQIPYSIGLGVGMVLFLNQWFKKRFNEEPSPLEVEIFNYQKDVDNYIAYHENNLNEEERYL